MDKFIRFISCLSKETRDDFYLNLTEIEEISGQHLSKSAYVYPAYWSTSGTHYLANEILGCGFKVKPDLRNKRIRLVRVEPGSGLIEKRQRVSKRIRITNRRTDVPSPSIEEVGKWLAAWNKLEDYESQERAINRVFSDYSSNDNLENVLIKCSILNDFYSTNIFKIFPVAKHILSLNIDERLKAFDPTLVDDIAKNDVGGKSKNFYSFASKYCSHHNQFEFPIYDSYVDKVLRYFRNVDGFSNFEDNDLKNYPKFKNILIEFRKFYGLEQFNLKELDKFLWQFGKKHFPKKY